MRPRSRLPAVSIRIQAGTDAGTGPDGLEEGKRVDKWLKEEFRKHCAKTWGSEEKEFCIEVDGIKIFGHADGVPTLDRYGGTVAEIKSMSNYGSRNALSAQFLRRRWRSQ
jgi:hypothetical protein